MVKKLQSQDETMTKILAVLTHNVNVHFYSQQYIAGLRRLLCVLHNKKGFMLSFFFRMIISLMQMYKMKKNNITSIGK